MRKISLVGVSFVVIAAGLASAAVDMLPFRIDEQRTIAFAKDKIGHTGDSLRVTFVLKGPEALAASSYGDLKLEEAADDTGTSLIPAKDAFGNATKFKEFSNAFFRKHDLDKHRPADDPEIQIELAPAKRAATKIARIRGTISIADKGTLKSIELAGLQPGDKRKLEIPENAGVTITTNIKKGSDIKEVEIEIAGSEDAIDSLDVYDAQDNKISTSAGGWSMAGGPVHRTLNLQKPLDETMKLVAKVSVDRTITKIPFDLKDIDLP